MTARRIVLLSLALLALGAGAVVALGSRQGEVEGGPIDAGEGSSSYGAPVPVDGIASFGMIFAVNDGDEPATLRRVDLAEASENLEVVGAYAQRPGRPGVGLLEGFPPRGIRGERLALPGATVEPGETLRVVVGLRARGAGWHTVRGFELRYRAGDTSYVAKYDLAVRLCSPRERWFGRCPAP